MVRALVAPGAKMRSLDTLGLSEVPSTRLLVDAARLIDKGLDPRLVTRAAQWTDCAGSLRAFVQLMPGVTVAVQETQAAGGVPDSSDAMSGDNADENRSKSDGTEAAAPGIEDLTLVSLADKKPMKLPTHSFDKVETSESFNGTLRQLDGDDELDEHLETVLGCVRR